MRVTQNCFSTFLNTVGALESTLGTQKKFPQLELAAHENEKIQSLYGSCEKQCFVKAAVSRAVRLRQCPLGELLLYAKVVERIR